MMRRQVAFLLVGALLVLLAFAMDPRGFGHMRGLEEDVERIRRENALLRRENERLRANLRRLADDPEALEAAAREELGLVRPGEVIFHLEREDGPLAP